MSPRFCWIKVQKCPHFFTKFDFVGVSGKNAKSELVKVPKWTCHHLCEIWFIYVETAIFSTKTKRAQAGAETSKNGENSIPTAAPAKSGCRNMAETTPMSSQMPTSYSTLYTLGGLSRLLLSVCRGVYCITPIINIGVRAKNDYHLCYMHPGEWSQNTLFVSHYKAQRSAVFENARGAKFGTEYICTESRCAADFSQFKTTLCVLVKSVIESWPTYTIRPTAGANLAIKSESYRICCTRFEIWARISLHRKYARGRFSAV